jgi:lysozyme family protein
MAADCAALPAGVDLVIFDTALNSGAGRARRFRDATAAVASPVARIKAISERRRAFHRGLDAFARYGRAWLGRVARIEALAVRMALEPVHEAEVADAKLHPS